MREYIELHDINIAENNVSNLKPSRYKIINTTGQAAKQLFH